MSLVFNSVMEKCPLQLQICEATRATLLSCILNSAFCLCGWQSVKLGLWEHVPGCSGLLFLSRVVMKHLKGLWKFPQAYLVSTVDAVVSQVFYFLCLYRLFLTSWLGGN